MMNYTMFLYEVLLFILTATLILGVPFYEFFRKRMVSSERQIFSRRRVVKVTIINLGLNIAVYLIFLAMLIILLLKIQEINYQIILVSITFLIVTGLAFYGNGIYITSIVIEAFTLPELKKLNSFKIQFVATHLFHGPISHILIYSSYIIALFLLGLLDILTGKGSLIFIPYLMICGIVTGIMHALGQILNGTIPYQFLTSVILFILFLFFIYFKGSSLFGFSVASYFFSFSVAFLLSGLLYFFLKGRREIIRSLLG